MAGGITRIAVEGFKSIAKRQEIEIRPLTILAGANSSGKSAIMQPLLMLKQTLEATFDPGALWIAGPNAKFANGQQFFSRIEGQREPGIKVDLMAARLGVGVEGPAQKFETSIHWGNSGFEVIEQKTTEDTRTLRFRPDMSDEEIHTELGPEARDAKLSVMRNRFLLDYRIAGGVPITSQWVEPFIRRMIHVPGARSNPSRTYPSIAVGSNFPGTFEYYVGSVIFNWQTQDRDRHIALVKDLTDLDLACNVHAERLSDTEIDVQVSRLPKGNIYDMVSVADVGLGVSHVLPAVVALRAAERPHVVYIEQPEIHLHPLAQTKLAKILAETAKRDVRLVVETHSSLLLRAIQTLVAKGDLDPDLVALHWFTRDGNGVTKVNSAKLDASGAFGDWPEDFGDVALRSEQEYLDAVEGRLTR